MASSEEPARKKIATKSSFKVRLCVLCQGDKFTNIKGDHQVGQLRQPALQSYQPLVDCIQHRAKYHQYGVAHLERNCTISMQCDTNHVMAKQHTSNTLREIKLDIAKWFYPMSQVYCCAA